MAAANTMTAKEAKTILSKAGYAVRIKKDNTNRSGHFLFVYRNNSDAWNLKGSDIDEIINTLGFKPENFIIHPSATFYIHSENDTAGIKKIKSLYTKLYGIS